MSEKERRRAAVLRQVVDGEGTLQHAAPLLGVSYRQAKRLLRRFREGGAKGLRHGNVGRASNRRWPDAERARVLAVVQAHYGGAAAAGAGQRFGPTLAAEHLFMDHGILVPVPTLRRWMQGAGLWSRARKARTPFVRRARRPAFGELVQLDGSFHDWFEGRAPRPCLMSLVDDATSTQWSRFGDEETTWAALDVLRAWIARYGIPRALYVDRKNVYVREATTAERTVGREAVTQFGRVCRHLGIELIAATTPQAKGRVERNHGTGQDRLVKKLRLAHIADIVTANAYLEHQYLPAHNARFAVPPANGLDAHVPLPKAFDWNAVFVLEEERRVGADWVVRYHKRALQIRPTRAAQRRTGPGQRVFVREARDGTLTLMALAPASGRELPLAWTPVESGTAAPVLPSPAVLRVEPTPPPAPAGYTRKGKPLSARQMAVRERWSNQITALMERRYPERLDPTGR